MILTRTSALLVRGDIYGSAVIRTYWLELHPLHTTNTDKTSFNAEHSATRCGRRIRWTLLPTCHWKTRDSQKLNSDHPEHYIKVPQLSIFRLLGLTPSASSTWKPPGGAGPVWFE